MTQRITEYANAWVMTHLHSNTYNPDDAIIESFVVQLIADARKDTISRQELEEGLGDLHDFIVTAMADSPRALR